MAFAANGWTQDRLIYECLRHRQCSLARELRKAGLDPEAIAKAADILPPPFLGVPERDMSCVHEVGPGD